MPRSVWQQIARMLEREDREGQAEPVALADYIAERAAVYPADERRRWIEREFAAWARRREP